MKRTLAAIMALVMALTLLPAAALAEGDLATPAGLAWDTDGTTATWKAVENAQGYYVALYSGEHSDTCGDKNKIVSQQTTDTKYNFAEELKAAGAGDYHFHVVATASGMADSGKAFSDKITYAPVVAVTGVTRAARDGDDRNRQDPDAHRDSGAGERHEPQGRLELGQYRLRDR